MSACGPFLREAEGNLLLFYCPGCKSHHHVKVADGWWTFDGNEAAPTIRPSVLVNSGRACPTIPQCHSFVTAGQIQYLADCTHDLAGQTVSMVEIAGAPDHEK